MASEKMNAVFAKVTASLPGGGEERPGQLAMADGVARAIARERHLVVQAGTGTGKSLAYLVPAVLSGKRVVVATATKALQDQLADKDLPALSAALSQPIAFAVLKGRSNYLCLQRAAEVEGRGLQQEIGAAEAAGAANPVSGLFDEDPPSVDEGARVSATLPTARLADQLRALLEWSRRSTTGDRADLDFEPHPRAWAMVSVGPRECPGAARCPEGSRCFAERARSEAAQADVVVVNAHLYGAHLASGGTVLPEHEVVVFDEAHELEDVMTESLGMDLAPGRLRALHTMARALLDAPGRTVPDLADAADQLRRLLVAAHGCRVLADPAGPHPRAEPSRAGAMGMAPAPGGRERSFFGLVTDDPPAARTAGAGGGVSSSDELAATLELASGRVERLRGLLLDASDAPSRGGADGRRARALAAAGHLADDLRRLTARRDDEVAWVDGTADAPVLRLAPVDVGPVLAATLWGNVTAVLTSATVPQRVEERLGLEGADVDHLDVGSPFDFRNHALLYVARHLPDRRRPEAEAALIEELGALIEAAGGRTLALFTSQRACTAAAAALAEQLPYRVLVQGSLPKRRLLETFAEDETSCLFATLGFWQGVDIPGRALSLVAVDRLPFGRPDDPLLVARRERAGPAAFSLVDLPRAATLLAQGVGRLIRSADDRGVVAVLDPRLATAGYRRVLLDGLPPMRRTVRRDEVVDFLDRVLGRGGDLHASGAERGSLDTRGALP